MPDGRREGAGDGGRGEEGRRPGGTGGGFDGEGGVETFGATELEILNLKTERHDDIKRKRDSKEDEPGVDADDGAAIHEDAGPGDSGRRFIQKYNILILIIL